MSTNDDDSSAVAIAGEDYRVDSTRFESVGKSTQLSYPPLRAKRMTMDVHTCVCQLIRAIDATLDAEKRGNVRSDPHSKDDGMGRSGRVDTGAQHGDKRTSQLRRSAVYMLNERLKETANKVHRFRPFLFRYHLFLLCFCGYC